MDKLQKDLEKAIKERDDARDLLYVKQSRVDALTRQLLWLREGGGKK